MKSKQRLLCLMVIFSMLSVYSIPVYGAVSPIPIYSWADLYNIRNNMSGSYILMSDLNESSVGYAAYVGGGWQPIGDFVGTEWDPDPNQSIPFTGSFDGNGHSISGLVSNRATDDGVGLFAYINRGSVINLNLINVNVSGHRHIGGLAGFLAYATISGCTVSGNVKAEHNVGGLLGTVRPQCLVTDCSSSAVVVGQVVVRASLRCGGLIGASYSSEIVGCSASGGVTGNFFDTGGLIGSIYDGTRINDCFTTNNVYGTGAVAGLVGSTNQASIITNCFTTGDITATFQEVGGLVGNINYGTIVTNCYAEGNISGAGEWVGGLIGIVCNNSSVRSSYALGNVTNTKSLTGGLVGLLSTGSTIYNSYARGNVSGSGGVGGLVGLMDQGYVTGCYSTGASSGGYAIGGLVGARNNNSIVTDSYWDTITSGLSYSSGGTGLTTTAMVQAASFSGWDFTYLWKILSGNSYPYFIWQGNKNIPYAPGVTPNNPPDAVNDSFTVMEDSGANTLNVLVNDTDPNGDTLSVTAVTQGTNGSTTFSAANVVYTPKANFYGQDSFSYIVSDGKGGTDSAVVTLTVTNVNDAPVANPDQITVNQNSNGNLIDVLTNDSDLDGDILSIQSITQPAHGTAAISAGQVSYTPAAGYSGSDSMTYTASDGKGGTAVGEVKIMVVNTTVELDITVTASTRTAGKNLFVKATAVVNTGISNATVQGVWSDAATDADTGITNASGSVSLTSNEIKYKNTPLQFTFKVLKITVNGVEFTLTGETQDTVIYSKQ